MKRTVGFAGGGSGSFQDWWGVLMDWWWGDPRYAGVIFRVIGTDAVFGAIRNQMKENAFGDQNP
ncbi:MAG: hypothetical protein AAGE59_30010 [Cyanobacteria bacterium P01_F01_bin.86]